MVVSPVIGAVLYVWLHDRRSAERVIDVLVLWVVPPLVAWQIIPHAWERRTLWPLAAAAAGMLVLNLLERSSRRIAPHADNVAIAVGLASIAVHALLEGGALVPGQARSSFLVAVALHRVGVGFMIWWLISPRHGAKLAGIAVGSLVLASVVGSLLGSRIFHAHSPASDLYLAFVAGSLLHVIFHQGRADHRH